MKIHEKNSEIKIEKEKPQIEEKLVSQKTTCSSFDKNTFRDIKLMKKFLNDKGDNGFLENFELISFIASGSEGTFYRGKYLKGNNIQNVGLKFVITDKNELERKKKIKIQKNREVSLLRKLHHKNVICYYGEYILDDYNSCIIMELAKYGDLECFQRSLLKKKCLTETCINYLTKQILDGLEYIHKNKIVHLDIKQDNLLIDSNLNVKISDFSISLSYEKYKDDSVIILPFVGTSRFISPEVITRTKILASDCSKIDLYSLGVVLYYLAYGTYPYDLKSVRGDNYPAIAKAVKENELTFPEKVKISPMFKDFLKGILNKDIHKRFNIHQACNHSWIKASKFIFEEKEKISCPEVFMISLITDSFNKFNDFVYKR